MPQSNTLERDQPTVEYDPGRTKTVSLPREHWYEYLDLVLEADVTVDAANASKDRHGILDLIENVSVEYNGNRTPKSQSFAMSHFVDYYEYGSRPMLEPIDYSTDGSQTAVAQSFVQFLLEPGNLATPLPSFLFSTYDLKIKWADETAIGSGVTVDNAEVKITSRERKRDSINGESRVLENLMVFKEREQTQPVHSSGDTVVELPRGNVYHSYPVLSYDDGSPSDGLVEEIEVVENGVDTHKSVAWDMQQYDDYQSYAIDEPVTGLAFPGYAKGADIADAVDTRGMDSYELILDTAAPTGDAEVRTVTRELIMPDD